MLLIKYSFRHIYAKYFTVKNILYLYWKWSAQVVVKILCWIF